MRRAARSFSFFFAMTAGIFASVAGMFALGRAVHTDPIAMNLTVMAAMPRGLKVLAGHAGNPETYSVAFMGDSTVIAYPEGKTLHERLGSELASRWGGPGRTHVESLSSLGMTPAGFFLVADEITAAQPDVAIVTANLSLMRDPLPANLQRPELAGWVYLDRAYETLVSLELHQYGVTADRLLLYKLFVATGNTGPWLEQSQNQARLGHLRGDIEPMVAERTGWTGEVETRRRRQLLNRVEIFAPQAQGEPERFNRKGASRKTAEVMAGIDDNHWAVAVLRALLTELAASGTATVLYIPPINLEHLRSLGVLNEVGLARTLQTLERVAQDTGAQFADLHDLLPDAAFRDVGGHFTHDPPYDGPRLVAEALAPYVQVELRAVAQTR